MTLSGGEFAFIDWLRRQTPSDPRVLIGPGDDAAALRLAPNAPCLITTDMLLEGSCFRLAEADLKMRGPGDFFGVRQSGVPALQIADLSDTPLIELSRSLAASLWESDPYLKQQEHKALREKMHLFWQDMMAH